MKHFYLQVVADTLPAVDPNYLETHRSLSTYFAWSLGIGLLLLVYQFYQSKKEHDNE